MHYRRLACFLIGAWLAGSLFMAMVATQNFRSVDRLLAKPSPAASRSIQALGQNGARALLRYHVSEQNRWYFENWEFMQLAIGLLLLMVLLFGSKETTFSLLVAAVMILIVVAERFILTPEIISLGRSIDFLPPDAPSLLRQRFWQFHSAYSSLELVKWALAALLAVRLFRRRQRLAQGLGEFHVVHKADHRHVNG